MELILAPQHPQRARLVPHVRPIPVELARALMGPDREIVFADRQGAKPHGYGVLPIRVSYSGVEHAALALCSYESAVADLKSVAALIEGRWMRGHVTISKVLTAFTMALGLFQPLGVLDEMIDVNNHQPRRTLQ